MHEAFGFLRRGEAARLAARLFRRDDPPCVPAGPLVLVAHADPIARERWVTLLLAIPGVAVVIADRPEHAHALAARTRPDVVLAGVPLADATLETARAWRHVLPDVRILVAWDAAPGTAVAGARQQDALAELVGQGVLMPAGADPRGAASAVRWAVHDRATCGAWLRATREESQPRVPPTMPVWAPVRAPSAN